MPRQHVGFPNVFGMTPTEIARFRADLDALAPSGRIAAAISGGPDSLALLLLLHAVRPGFVLAATVDHRLRPEAADEAAMVAKLCGGLGVSHVTLAVTVADHPDGPQASARKARYAALGNWAESAGAAYIATAHHADDQAETLLMRLARGAGLPGLAGVRRSRPLDGQADVILIRPLLDWRKAALEAICQSAGLEPARDPSNHDTRYDRTRARALLQGGWPDAVRAAASAHHLAEAEEALAWMAATLADSRIILGRDNVKIDATDLPRALRRRLLLIGMERLNPAASPRGDAVERLLDSLEGGAVTTLAGLRCDPGPPWRFTIAPARRAH